MGAVKFRTAANTVVPDDIFVLHLESVVRFFASGDIGVYLFFRQLQGRAIIDRWQAARQLHLAADFELFLRFKARI